MDYLLVKWVHVLSSTVLFGTGIGSAFYLLMASLRSTPPTIAFVAGRVVVADWLFTTTTAVLQPLTGWYLVERAGLAWDSRWLLWSVVLYAFAIGCWLPVVWIQYRMHAIARDAADANQPLPPAYRRALVWWIALGFPALFAFLAIFWLMIAKPL